MFETISAYVCKHIKQFVFCFKCFIAKHCIYYKSIKIIMPLPAIRVNNVANPIYPLTRTCTDLHEYSALGVLYKYDAINDLHTR